MTRFPLRRSARRISFAPLRTFAVALALGLAGCAQDALPNRSSSRTQTAVATPAPWAHESSDLKADPAVTWGRLENGLRYAILPHDTPGQRASLFLLVQAGSLHERNSELGFAHFVEHMAFRGTRGFPGDEATQSLQRLGVDAGAHANASTTPFETEYHLNDLPVEEAGALATGLGILRGVADGILFEEAAVQQERGVIFGEERSRSGTLAQARPDELEFLAPRSETITWPEVNAVFPGTRLVKRPALGAESTLRAATGAKLRAFYDRWYRPERMILGVAGDLAPAEVERLIRENFSTLAGHGKPPAEISQGAPAAPSGRPRVYWQSRDSEPATQLTLAIARAVAAPDTMNRRRETLARNVALALLERRLERAVESPAPPFTSAGANVSHLIPGHELTLIRAATPPEAWPKALAALDTEFRRARELGFSAEEFALGVKKYRANASGAAAQARSQPAADLAAALAFAIGRGVVFTTAGDDLRLLDSQLAALTPGECQAALRALLPAGHPSVALLGPLTNEKRDVAMARTTLAEKDRIPLTAYPVPPPSKPFPYTDFGPPGKIEHQEHSAILDADLIRFTNGTRLNLKQTAFEPGRVRFHVRLGGTRFPEPESQPGLVWRSFAWIMGGLRDLSRDDERAALTELAGGRSMTVDSSEAKLVADGSAEDLPLMLQVTTAYFAHPAFRAEEFDRSLEVTRSVIAPLANTATGAAKVALLHRLSGQHRSQRLPLYPEIAARTREELQAWLVPVLKEGALEITIVGDFDRAQVVDAVARTFGALPLREWNESDAAKIPLVFPPTPFSDTVNFEGRQSLAVVTLAWPSAEITTFPGRLRGLILADILADRLRRRLRDELGETYSTSAEFGWNDDYAPALTFLSASIEAAPDRVQPVAAAIQEVAEALARDGATAEEFERARRPRVRTLESNLHHNEWWLDPISVAQSNPARAEGLATAMHEYRGATREEINALAQTLIVRERQSQLITTPKTAGETTAKP